MAVKILNLNKCLRKLGDLDDIDIMPEIIDGIRRIQGTAKEYSPVGTPESTGIKGYVGGTLKGSIMTKTDHSKQEGIVYTLVEYAIYQEFGTVKMRPHPFMIPAFNQHERTVRKRIEDSARKQLKDNVK